MEASKYFDHNNLENDKNDDEKLLQLLHDSSKKKIDFQRSRSLSGTNSSDTDAENQLDTNYPEKSSSSSSSAALLHYNQVPRGGSTAIVAQVIRNKFFHACDVNKEHKQVIQELNDAQVNLIHVPATYKNAADEKLKQSIRRFADIHASPAAIILISSDVNFAADLSDLRHRKKLHVILLHNDNSSEALILCANEHYNFMELMEPLPARTPAKTLECYDLLISNLPSQRGLCSIKRRLKRLSDNCGGRVIGINANSAIIRFSSQDSADRAQKRMNGENVFDAKIVVRFLKDKENRRAQVENLSLDLVSESGTATASPVQMYNLGGASSGGGARSLPGTPYCQSSSPVATFPRWNGMHYPQINPPTTEVMPPAPMFRERSYPNSNGDCYNRGHFTEPRPTYSHNKYNKIPFQNSTPVFEGMRPIRGGHSVPNNFHERGGGGGPRFHCPMPSFKSYNGANNNTQHNYGRRSPSPFYQNQSCGGDSHHWNSQPQQQQQQNSSRNIRTPSPFESSHLMRKQPSRVPSPFHHQHQLSGSESDEMEHMFNPIQQSTFNTTGPIELLVTNLDQNIDSKEIKRILGSLFAEHVVILHLSLFIQSDGIFAASVKVPSLQDAQYAISQLHRRRVGYKRIIISYAHTNGPNHQLIRSQIVMLLQEVPGHKLPLVKFREMYERRFLNSFSISELQKLKDVCVITGDNTTGRIISLNEDHRNTPSPCLSAMSQPGDIELPYCTIHTQKGWLEKGWAEQEMVSLPNVMMSLKTLSIRIHQLLTTHNGSLPLPSLSNCYEAEFSQPMNIDENGVPLEHLVSCLPSVKLRQAVTSVKFVVWADSQTSSDDSCEDQKSLINPQFVNQLSLLSRELVDLLKTAPHSQLLFNRLIPAYHHHFGRQCRVADYGFTKLIDLLETLKHTIQVMGEGTNRIVTLSHRAQIRRFTSDLLRVLKSQACKQIRLSDFPDAYARIIGKPWDIVDYGVCQINDILGEVSESTIVVSNISGDAGDDKLIAIPMRQQTPEEIERTKQFAVQVVELLRHAPQCKMLFNRFVPSYHHHFGHQCRVSDYGFTKLIELFEAIPDVVNIEETSTGEKQISLTDKESWRVLREHISQLILKSNGSLLVSKIPQTYLYDYGYMLRPEKFNCKSILDLLEKLNDTVCIFDTANGLQVELIDKTNSQKLALQCRKILMDQREHRLSTKVFQHFYNQYYGSLCDIDELKTNLTDAVEFSVDKGEEFIGLTPIQSFACKIQHIIINSGGKILLHSLENIYASTYGEPCNVSKFGYSNLLSVLEALSCTFFINETRNNNKMVFLNPKLSEVGIDLPVNIFSPRAINPTSPRAAQALHLPQNNKNNSSWIKNQSYWHVLNLAQKVSEINEQSQQFYSDNYREAPKSDSSPEDDDYQKMKNKKSVWNTPPSRLQSVCGAIEIPPFSLPIWEENDDNDLMSPVKNLLPAVPNPLSPPDSPFFSGKHQHVVAPHPSELPLPSASLSAKRANKNPFSSSNHEARLADYSADIHSPNNSTYYSLSEENDLSSGTLNITPSKRQLTNIRRLATQFNSPIDEM